jgi:uncharacterized protein YacL
MIGSDEDFMAFAGGSAIIGLFIGPIIVLFIDKFGIKIFAIIIVSLISLIGIFMSLKLYQENQQEKYNNGYIFNKKIELT